MKFVLRSLAISAICALISYSCGFYTTAGQIAFVTPAVIIGWSVLNHGKGYMYSFRLWLYVKYLEIIRVVRLSKLWYSKYQNRRLLETIHQERYVMHMW